MKLTASHTVYTQTADPDLYLHELALGLALNYNIAISVPTFQQILTEAGLTREILLTITFEREEVDETGQNEHMYARHYGPTHYGD